MSICIQLAPFVCHLSRAASTQLKSSVDIYRISARDKWQRNGASLMQIDIWKHYWCILHAVLGCLWSNAKQFYLSMGKLCTLRGQPKNLTMSLVIKPIETQCVPVPLLFFTCLTPDNFTRQWGNMHVTVSSWQSSFLWPGDCQVDM
jgi:hypothetical protein